MIILGKGWEAVISMMVTIPSVVYRLPVLLNQLIAMGFSSSQDVGGVGGVSWTIMTSGKGVKTDKSMPSCKRDLLLEGSGLALFSIEEASLAMLRLWGASSMTQGILGNGVQRVIGSGSLRASTLRIVQYLASNCHSNGV